MVFRLRCSQIPLSLKSNKTNKQAKNAAWWRFARFIWLEKKSEKQPHVASKIYLAGILCILALDVMKVSERSPEDKVKIHRNCCNFQGFA